MSDRTCLEHDELKHINAEGYPYCVTCRRIELATEELRTQLAQVTAQKDQFWKSIEELSQRVLQLEAEGLPGVLHEVDRAFYNLTVQQRDAAWREVESLRARVAELEREVATTHGVLARVQGARCERAERAEAEVARVRMMFEDAQDKLNETLDKLVARDAEVAALKAEHAELAKTELDIFRTAQRAAFERAAQVADRWAMLDPTGSTERSRHCAARAALIAKEIRALAATKEDGT